MFRSTIFLLLAIIAGLIAYHGGQLWAWAAAVGFFTIWIFALTPWLHNSRQEPPTMRRTKK